MTAATAQMRRRRDIVPGHESLRFSLPVGTKRIGTTTGVQRGHCGQEWRLSMIRLKRIYNF
jgi:hypothetical protein